MARRSVVRRDQISRPSRGKYRAGFALEDVQNEQHKLRLCFQQEGEEIKCVAAIPPAIRGLSIDHVAINAVKHLSEFSREFIKRIHPRDEHKD